MASRSSLRTMTFLWVEAMKEQFPVFRVPVSRKASNGVTKGTPQYLWFPPNGDSRRVGDSLHDLRIQYARPGLRRPGQSAAHDQGPGKGRRGHPLAERRREVHGRALAREHARRDRDDAHGEIRQAGASARGASSEY